MARAARSGSGRKRSAKKEEHWRRIISRQRRSGLTQAEFCRREGVAAYSYSWWKRELVKRDTTAPNVGEGESQLSLVPVTLKQASAPLGAFAAFEVVLTNGRMLRVPTSFDATALKRLVSVLEDSTC